MGDKPFYVEEARMGQGSYTTDILVRAMRADGTYFPADIWELDAISLLRWLRSRGHESPWAEQVVFLLLDRTNAQFNEAWEALRLEKDDAE